MSNNISALMVIDDKENVIYQKIFQEETMDLENYFSGAIRAFDNFASSFSQDSIRSMNIGEKNILLKAINWKEEKYIFVLIISRLNKAETQINDIMLDLIIDRFCSYDFQPKEKQIDEIIHLSNKLIEEGHQKKVTQENIKKFMIFKERDKNQHKVDGFFIITSGGTCLFQHIFDKNFGIDSQLLSAFISAIRAIIIEMTQDEVRSLNLGNREFIFRKMELEEDKFILFVLVTPSDSIEKQKGIFKIWLEFATYAFQNRFKKQLERLKRTGPIKPSEYRSFTHDFLEILKAKPKRFADFVETDQEHIVFLQLLLDELVRHVPINFLHIDESFIKVSGRKLLVPSDITSKEAKKIAQMIEKEVAVNFGQKIYDMAVRKVTKKQ